jgi:hypothetical protein
MSGTRSTTDMLALTLRCRLSANSGLIHPPRGRAKSIKNTYGSAAKRRTFALATVAFDGTLGQL